MKLVSRDHCNCTPISSSWLGKVRGGRAPDPGAGSKPPALTTVGVGLWAGRGQQWLRREPRHGLPPRKRRRRAGVGKTQLGPVYSPTYPQRQEVGVAGTAQCDDTRFPGSSPGLATYKLLTSHFIPSRRQASKSVEPPPLTDRAGFLTCVAHSLSP